MARDHQGVRVALHDRLQRHLRPRARGVAEHVVASGVLDDLVDEGTRPGGLRRIVPDRVVDGHAVASPNRRRHAPDRLIQQCDRFFGVLDAAEQHAQSAQVTAHVGNRLHVGAVDRDTERLDPVCDRVLPRIVPADEEVGLHPGQRLQIRAYGAAQNRKVREFGRLVEACARDEHVGIERGHRLGERREDREYASGGRGQRNGAPGVVGDGDPRRSGPIGRCARGQQGEPGRKDEKGKPPGSTATPADTGNWRRAVRFLACGRGPDLEVHRLPSLEGWC